MTSVPSSIVAVDTETTPRPLAGPGKKTVHTLTLGVAVYARLVGGQYTREDAITFATTLEFWAWLYRQAEKKPPTWVWAHNLGYDWAVLRGWREIEEGRLLLSKPTTEPPASERALRAPAGQPALLCLQDPPTIMCMWTREGHAIRFVDLMNWLPHSLARIGEWVGRPKMEMPRPDRDRERLAQYCENDARIVLDAAQRLCQWVTEHDLGHMRYTLASQAMAFYRHRCMAYPIGFHDRADVKRLERAAYYGGRTLVHFRGRVRPPLVAGEPPLPEGQGQSPVGYWGPVYHLDIRGCYPSVMQGHDYPCQLIKVVDNPSLRDVESLSRAHELVGDVTVRTAAETYPVRTQGETHYPHGTYRTALAGPELREALSMGHLWKCHQLAVYSRCRLFDRFVDVCWQCRQRAAVQGEELGGQLWKTLANSLHGKFAQRMDRWETVPELTAPTPWGLYTVAKGDPPVYRERRAIAGTVQERSRDIEGPETFPAIAAYVSSYARLLVQHYVESADVYNVLYQDADSIHVTQEGFDLLSQAGCINPCRLGHLHVVRQADSAEYYGPRHYRIGGDLVQVGVACRHWSLPNGRIGQEVWQGLESQILGPPIGGPVVEEVAITPPAPLIRGRVSPGGWVQPLAAGVSLRMDAPLWLREGM